MKAKELIGAGDQVRLQRRKFLDPCREIDAGAICGAQREIEVHLEMARLRGMQGLEQLARLAVDDLA